VYIIANLKFATSCPFHYAAKLKAIALFAFERFVTNLQELRETIPKPKD
jgi:hypothetical protein